MARCWPIRRATTLLSAPGADSRSTDKPPKSGVNLLPKNVVTHALDLTTKYAQPIKVVFKLFTYATQQTFYVNRLSTRAISFFLILTPQMTPYLNGLFVGFPEAFTCSKSEIS